MHNFTALNMTQNSKKGACSSHTTTAKTMCLKHNRREQVPGYVNPHLSMNNRTIFEADCIRGRKSITPLVHQAEKLYTEKTGQKVQKSFAAFRESVLVVREGVTDEQLQAFIRRAEALTGWKAVGCWLHLDEGHVRSKYIEGQDGFSLNAHAHVLWDCQNHETGKSIKCQRNQLSQMQDILAEATGMERGNYAQDTGVKRRTAQEQRIHAQEQRIKELEEKIETLSAESAAKDAIIESWRTAKDTAIAAGNWLRGKLNLSDKDAVIRTQKAQLASLAAERDQAKADACLSEKKAAEAEKRGYNAACDDVFRVGEWDARCSIKETHTLDSISRHILEERKEKELWRSYCMDSDAQLEELKKQLAGPSQSQSRGRGR